MESVVSARTLFEQSEGVTPNPQNAQDEAAVKHKRNLKLAYEHALLIQHQKDVETQILTTIETLCDIPQGNRASRVEQDIFLEEISLFQPSDVADLVAERVSQTRCGYVLCDQKPRSRAWHLPTGSTDFCSSTCQGNAEYIKMQLNIVPAWERGPGGQRPQIVLPEEQRRVIAASAADPDAELAFERGEKKNSQKPAQVMEATIIEKGSVSHVQATQPPSTNNANSVEGYVPRRGQDESPGHRQATQELEQPNLETKVVNTEDDEQQQWDDMFAHLQKG